MKFVKITAFALTAMLLLGGCSKDEGASSNNDVNGDYDMSIDGNVSEVKIEKGDKVAIINVRDFGEMKIKLFPEAAPVGVDNFIRLAESGYYNGKNIHRIYADFMIQAGSANGDGTGGFSADGGTFDVEYHPNARHFYGAISYANSGGQNTCQFFIVNNKSSVSSESIDSYIDDYNKENIWTDDVRKKYEEVGGAFYLDKDYTVFGQVVEGFDVLDSISAVEVKENPDLNGELSSPVNEIIIESVTIYTEE
ncbi:MAG: peptidylprolyl isomerase [Clostridiales bacterium]|nr:peptidylprolyl isomerase [Clostridiales bacterium]